MLTERIYPGEGLLSEAPGTLSRDTVTIAESQTLKAGQPLGKVATAADVSRAAAAGNTGNGVLTLANPAFGGAVKPGLYKVTCIEPASNGGTFSVEDPDGAVVGIAKVGVAFAGEIKFTIADDTDFAAGDIVNVTVANVVWQHKAYDPAATDGAQVFAGILYDAVTTGSGETLAATAFVRQLEWRDNAIVWGSLTSDQKAAARVQARARGIIIR
jgi:hypothetical protein